MAIPLGSLGPSSRPWAVAIGLPFGRITGVQLSGLVAAAVREGCSEIGPSTERSLVLPWTELRPAEGLLAAACDLGLMTTSDDPRRGVEACPGAPACGNASTDTRRDATLLAAHLAGRRGQAQDLHVSGCSKGCAHPQAAALTLVAADGRYSIVRHGGCQDRPASEAVPPGELCRHVDRILGGAHG